MKGRVLSIAGSDSGGGAGIQADIKTITALGGYAMTALTALTAQDTKGVHGIVDVPLAFVRQQMEVVLRDLGADAIKTGMLHTADMIALVAETLRAEAPGVPLVVDPVMVAKGGARLLQEDATAALRETLLPLATVLTPNIPEAEVLTRISITGEAGMEEAGQSLLEAGAGAVLMKGGHLEGDDLVDLLVTPDGVQRFSAKRIATANTHGTGCTTASAIATGLAQGLDLPEAVRRALAYVRAAIAAAPGFGHGHGPLDHGHPLTSG